jgi:predicted adenine nucleotide alpha hydrolase (AANH) superfamily ATPase
VNKPRLLVHVCCAPDALYVLGELRETYETEAFFSNSNIHPEDEYTLRLAETWKVARHLGLPLHEDDYDPDRWLALTRKFKDDPEKGRRCDVCYALRLLRTGRKAAEEGFDAFATVMSLSPWKKAAVLNRIGRQFGVRFGIGFLEADFKKKDGFRKSLDLGRNLGLYRQDYCGCLYSRQARDRRRPAPGA